MTFGDLEVGWIKKVLSREGCTKNISISSQEQKKLIVLGFGNKFDVVSSIVYKKTELIIKCLTYLTT